MATYSANTQYEYSNQILGSYSGGTWESALGNAPHPISYKLSDPLNLSSSGNTVYQMNAITIGGINGLNN
jgi:hypothetical protein